MTIGIEGYTYRGYDLVHFTKTDVTLVHAHDNREILHQAPTLNDACLWVDRHIRGANSPVTDWGAPINAEG